MAKFRNLTKAPSRGKKLRPQRRVNVGELPKTDRKSLNAYAAIIKKIVDTEDGRNTPFSDDETQQVAVELKQTVKQVREAISQYRRYHAAYPGQHPANAFTPLLRDQEQKDSSDKEVQSTRKKLPKGMPLVLISDLEEREQI